MNSDKTPEIRSELVRIYYFSGKVKDLKIHLGKVLKEEEVSKLH